MNINSEPLKHIVHILKRFNTLFHNLKPGQYDNFSMYL